MNRPYRFYLFISSPDDVRAERDAIEKMCSDWNTVHSANQNVVIAPVRWERDLPAQTINGSVQNYVNEHLLTKADIIFALMWKKVGEPTEEHDSGTIEEIEEGIRRKIPTTVYFITRKFSPTTVIPEHLEKINKFKKNYKNKGVYRELETGKELSSYFQIDLEHHVKTLMNKYETVTVEKIKEVTDSTSDKSTGTNEYWYEKSISELINKFLRKAMIGVNYRKGITFNENCYIWKSSKNINHEASVEVARKAREYAFNEKYGNYYYEGDLRRNYLKGWYQAILHIFKVLGFSIDGKKVIGVGANNGSELVEIFTDKKHSTIEVLDLSSTAIENGRKKFHHVLFHQGNMEESPLTSDSYDIYVNLRSIHSSGVDYKQALADCFRILKKDGIAIISISNGYLAPDKPGSKDFFEVRGLYDSETQTFSAARPYILGSKILSKLQNYGFKKAGIMTGETEIFVYAIK